jgi:hypothetical protein
MVFITSSLKKRRVLRRFHIINYVTSNGEIVHECSIGKDLEPSYHDLIEALPRRLVERTEQNHEKPHCFHVYEWDYRRVLD